jgi:hypothetical protein
MSWKSCAHDISHHELQYQKMINTLAAVQLPLICKPQTQALDPFGQSCLGLRRASLTNTDPFRTMNSASCRDRWHKAGLERAADGALQQQHITGVRAGTRARAGPTQWVNGSLGGCCVQHTQVSVCANTSTAVHHPLHHRLSTA